MAIDDAMADVVARSTQPALAAIKLAWWRERLEELDQGKVPAEPRLQQVARELLPRGITGSSLAKLEEGWAALLEPVPDSTRVQQRGEVLFRLGAALLGAEFDKRLGSAGRLYALANIRRRGIEVPVGKAPDIGKQRILRSTRPLTALAALAERDLKRGSALEAEATPGRAWTLLRHWMTGRL